MKYLVSFLLFFGALHAQSFWKPVNSAGQTADFWSVGAGLDQYVAVGTGGAIISTTDGTFWSGSTSGTTNWLLSVAYGNGIWVAVGENGTILWADAGLHWSSATYFGTSNTQRLNGVGFGGGRFVAVGEGGLIFTSTDGKSWTPRTSPVTTALRGFAYGSLANGIQPFYLVTGAGGAVLYSTDATTWFRVQTPVTTFLEAVTINTSTATAVIVGQNGTILSGTFPTGWAVRSSGTTAWLRAVSSDGLGNYAASGENGTILTSSNLVNWSATVAGTLSTRLTNNFVGMTYHTNLNHLIAVGDAGSIVLSPDPSVLANVATRGFVGTGSNILIAGFVVTGPSPKRVMVRAIGPTLSIFSLTGLLAQPVLTVYDSTNVVVAQNTGWSANNSTATPVQIAQAISLTGAFPVQANSADSIVLKTLPPGAYTAQVSGANATTGTALVEVYQLP